MFGSCPGWSRVRGEALFHDRFMGELAVSGSIPPGVPGPGGMRGISPLPLLVPRWVATGAFDGIFKNSSPDRVWPDCVVRGAGSPPPSGKRLPLGGLKSRGGRPVGVKQVKVVCRQ